MGHTREPGAGGALVCGSLKQRPPRYVQKGADNSLARPERKQANVSVQNGVNFLRRLACAEYITGVLKSP